MRTAAVLLALALAGPLHGQWRPLSTGTTASLRGLSVVDDRTVWASGSRSTVLLTTDGGASWRVDTVPGGTFDVRAVHGRSATVAHAVATAGRIWRTVDGGTTWSLRYQAADTSVFLDAVDFWDDQHGIALGDPMGGRFFVLLTDDGGDTWREAPTASRPEAREGEAAFAASGQVLVVDGMQGAWVASGGRHARLHRSTDRGATWTAIDTPIRSGGSSTGIFGVTPAAKTLVLVGGDYTQDDSTRANAAIYLPGRKEWVTPTSTTGGFRSSVAAGRGGRLVLAVGQAGSDISDDGGRSWRPFDRTGFHAVRASANSVFYASGANGRIGVYQGTSH
ncbi:MAG: hypothetical protein IPK85_23250 [Gemmatimonadetes bacterium]|nr:hypothetical protein [Gemmatimonadota bacterium]